VARAAPPGFLLSGTARDRRIYQKVCVVDETFARRYWPQGNAIGQPIFSGSQKKDDSTVSTVIGVVGNVKQAQLTDQSTPGVVYFPFIFIFDRNYFLVARTRMPPEMLGEAQSVLSESAPSKPECSL
jgi:hypothetical protein